jgi:hypothetical protein
MILALYIVAAVILAVGSLYLAWQSSDFRKFLAGAFFVSSGVLFYLYLADVSVPLQKPRPKTLRVRLRAVKTKWAGLNARRHFSRSSDY